MIINKHLTYYCFDLDDNLLYMPSKIYLDKFESNKWKPIEVSTGEYAKVRGDKNYRFRNNSITQAFYNFNDNKNSTFMRDFKKAIKNKQFAPSWNIFIDCIINGNLFAIITSRGHTIKTMKLALRYIIDECLSKIEKELMMKNLIKFHLLFNTKYNSDMVINRYLNICEFICITNKNYLRKNKIKKSDIVIEKLKEKAIFDFFKRIHKFGNRVQAYIKVGISDDDAKNILHLKRVFLNKISNTYPKSKVILYDTSDHSMKKIFSS